MQRRPQLRSKAALWMGAAAVLALGLGEQPAAVEPSTAVDSPPVAATGRLDDFTRQYCTDCHSGDDPAAGLELDKALAAGVERQPDTWERVVRKLTLRQMPPADADRPDEPAYEAAIAAATSRLDAAAGGSPNPGRTESFRRLTRTEYRNAVRDLLALDVDAASLLPPDETSLGFDTVTVTGLSPTLLNRYVAAAETISRRAVGAGDAAVREETFRVRPDVTQDVHLEGLPIGTRGGTLIRYTFPRDGEYEVQVHLMRDRNEEVEGLHYPHELEVLLDRQRTALLTVAPPAEGQTQASIDANLTTRFRVAAGPHEVGVTFLKQSASLLETPRQPLHVHFNYYRHPRIGPAVFQVSIRGPYEAGGPGNSPSRRAIFARRPEGEPDEEARAEQILRPIVRRAWRRPVTAEDLRSTLALYRKGRGSADFDAGIEMALAGILVSPQFLFRIEKDPPGAGRGEAYHVPDVELASRLSFFVWSSIPDEELLRLAEEGELRRPEILEAQTRRMLADPRAQALVDNFAEQWLQLRSLQAATPDMRLFPDFDDNLRQAMLKETKLHFTRVVREDRSILELIRTGETFVDERLAKHYGIPHVYGSRFRAVPLSDDLHRGGLLRQASVLSATSYATRTSPVLRGKWLLDCVLGSPPPPPPPNVPVLEENSVSASLPVRARLARHREDSACASCHQSIDPPGFALENFDAVGRWRDLEEGEPVDASGSLIGGSAIDGPAGLEQAILDRPDLFARTFTEKLLTYALGRGVETFDGPSVRRIVRAAADEEYRFSSFILGIVRSPPFQMRTTP